MSRDFAELVAWAQSDPRAFREVPNAECVEAARAYYEEHWSAARAQHDAGASGGSILEKLTAAADEIVAGVTAFGLAHTRNPVALTSRITMVALGGYGRRELAPCSDLDLCLLYDKRLDPDIEALNAYLVPFLWDMGFKAGYAIHSVAEAAELSQADPEVLTTYAQARRIVGDTATYGRLKVLLTEIRSGNTRAAVDMILQREAVGALPEGFQDLHHPEPDLKENVGGLRDYHAGLWLILLTHGPHTLDDLARTERLSSAEHLELVDALNFVWRLRNEIHFHTGKANNRLTFALQKHVAQAFGYGDDSQRAVDRLMRDYYAAARKLRDFLLAACRICGRHTDVELTAEPDENYYDLIERDGQLHAGSQDPNWFAENPARLMEIFWECARRQVPLAPATARRVQKNLSLAGTAFRTNDVVRRFFVAICNRPLQAGFALRQMQQTGLLACYLPEFGDVADIVRYEDFHSYPVDEHTLRAVEALADLEEMEGPVGALLQRVLESVRDPYILVLSILLHDLGKVTGEEHVESGVVIAHQIGERMGLPTEDTERIAFHVRHHMLMSNIALYRDIDDVDVVNGFAQTMTGDERLRELLLLTYSDLKAVGPNVWTEWKGALLSQLYLKSERILTGRAGGTDGEEFWKLPKAQAMMEQLPADLRPEAERFLRGLGERYFVSFSPRHMARHLRCLLEARETGFSMRSAVHRDTGVSEIVVCTRDRPGLFATIAGSFAAKLTDVSSAQVFTTPDGYVLDCFSVSDAANARPLTESQTVSIERLLRNVLLDGGDIHEAVERSRNSLLGVQSVGAPVPVRISFDNDGSRYDTIVDVEAADRVGLLYDMAQALAEMGAEIQFAKIVTDARRVRDAFYIRRDGQRVETAEAQDQIGIGLQDAISGRPRAAVKGA